MKQIMRNMEASLQEELKILEAERERAIKKCVHIGVTSMHRICTKDDTKDDMKKIEDAIDTINKEFNEMRKELLNGQTTKHGF